jgi:hypothetical protein
MSHRTKVTVSRFRTINAQVTSFVSHEEYGATMSAEDFIKALVELSDTGMFTNKASLTTKLLATLPAILSEMKSQVAKVV